MLGSLRQDSLLYILNKKDMPIINTGRVVAVSQPAPRYPSNGFNPSVNGYETTVDITVVMDNGEKVNFSKVPSNLSVYGDSGVVIAENRDAISAELEDMRNISRKVMESYKFHEKRADECENLLLSLNPEIAKNKRIDEEIGVIKEQIGGLEDKITEVTQLIKKLSKKD